MENERIQFLRMFFNVLHVLDINECAVNNGGCEHDCCNSFGSFVCRCPLGYELAADGRHCEGKTLPSSVERWADKTRHHQN